MNTFAHALSAINSPPPALTANGMTTNADSGSALLDLFFILGASRGQDIREKFIKAWQEDPRLSMKMLFWARDVRGGAGERDTFRKLMQHVEKLDTAMVMKVLPLIPVYGRWDDVQVFETDQVKAAAVKLQATAILSGDALAAKWADRKGPWANMLRKQMGVDPKTYRKTIVALTQVVETLMCAKQWDQINYTHVPSVAGARYQKAFTKHDAVRYSEFKTAAVKGEVKINAGTLYPYDVLKSVAHGDATAALAQWQVLPNYLGDAGFMLPVIDTSGSMGSRVGGKNSTLTCMDVAISLGLYLADKQTGPFKDMFLNFHTHSKIHHLKGNLLEKVAQIQRSDWGGSTNLESAFKEILKVAVLGDVPEAEMPRYLLVISDMGFDACEQGHNPTAFDMAKEMFARHNYVLPTIVWWNVAHKPGGYGGDNNSPVKRDDVNTVMISGFSPSIMKNVLNAKSVTPYDVMMDTINNERYAAVEAALS
jgi:hypothetical protein